jgi:hypothetical protein
MLADIVVDCNVVAHAQMPDSGLNHQRSKEFMVTFLSADTKLGLDDRLFAEYENLGLFESPHELVAAFVKEVFANRRWLMLDASGLGATVHRRITQVVGDRHDSYLLRLGCVAPSSTLTSHDEAAFPRHIRLQIRESLGVNLVDGSEAARLIKD